MVIFIEWMDNDNLFLNSFSRLDIPDYLSKEKLEDRLMKAILEGKGFYLA